MLYEKEKMKHESREVSRNGMMLLKVFDEVFTAQL